MKKLITKILSIKEASFVYIFQIFLSILLLIIPFQIINHGLFFSSDNFYFPALFQDAIHNPKEIPIWNLPPAPVIVPDLLIFAISHLISFLNPIYSLSLFSLIIGIIIVFYLHKIYKLLIPEKTERINIQLWFLTILIFVLLLRMLGLTHEFLLPLFLTGHHGGSVLLTLILLYYLIQQYHKPRVFIWLLIFSLTLLGRWSDGILLTHLIIPFWIVSIFLFRKKDLKFIIICNILFITNLIFYPFKNLIFKGILTIPHYQPEKLIQDGWKKNGLPNDFFLNDIQHLIQNFSFLEIIIVSVSFLLLFLNVLQFFFLRSISILNSFSFFGKIKRDPYISEKSHAFLKIESNSFNRILFINFIFSSITVQFLSILAIQHYFSKDLLNATRYYSPIFFFLLMAVPLFLTHWKLTNIHLFSILLLWIGIFFFILFLYPIRIYSNPILACIDHNNELKSIRNNSYGVGDYWQAKPITVSSYNRIQVQPIWDLKAYEWVGRRRILQNGDKFHFAILGKGSSINEHAFQMKYGVPDKKVKCGDFEIYLYTNSNSF